MIITWLTPSGKRERAARVYGRANWADKAWWFLPRWRKYDWWSDRWPEYTSPFELAYGELWTSEGWKRSCNTNTIGIEVIPPKDDPKGPLSDACWNSIVLLTQGIGQRRKIQLARETVITHSDAHPVSRTNKFGPWDLAPKQFTFELFAERAGLPLVSRFWPISNGSYEDWPDGPVTC